MPAGESGPSGLSRKEIILKLNAIPTFTIVNASKEIVPFREDGSQEHTACWYVDAAEAKGALVQARLQNPDLQLHLGVTPLGIAFALAIGWQKPQSSTPLRLQASRVGAADLEDNLKGQCEAQGIDASGWQFPIFCCDELQGPKMMPMFVSRFDLAQTWEAAGKSKESIPSEITVMDLRVLVNQMQQDVFDWSTVHLIASQQAVELVQQAKGEQPAADPLDEVPPLM